MLIVTQDGEFRPETQKEIDDAAKELLEVGVSLRVRRLERLNTWTKS